MSCLNPHQFGRLVKYRPSWQGFYPQSKSGMTSKLLCKTIISRMFVIPTLLQCKSISINLNAQLTHPNILITASFRHKMVNYWSKYFQLVPRLLPHLWKFLTNFGVLENRFLMEIILAWLFLWMGPNWVQSIRNPFPLGMIGFVGATSLRIGRQLTIPPEEEALFEEDSVIGDVSRAAFFSSSHNPSSALIFPE